MSTQSRVTNFGDQGPSQMRYPGISMSHTAGSGVSAKIRKSSKFLKQQDLLFKRVNPCLDDQPFSILSKSLRTHEVNLRQLLRYATCADYFSMALGLSFSFLSAILYVATIQSFGLFHQFFSEDVAAPCLNIRTTDGTVWQFKYPYLWLCITLTVLSFFENVLLDFSAGRQCKRLQLAYVDALIRKDVTWFDCYIDRDLSFRVRKDMHEIRMGIGEALGELVFQTTASTLMLAASFMLNVKVAFIPLLIAPGFTIVSVLKLNAAKAIHQEDRRAYKPANDVVVQMLQKVLTIKTFGGEGKAVNAYASSLYCVWDLRKLILLAALWSSLCWFISMVSHPFLIWISVDYFDDYTEKMSNIKNCKRCDTSLIWVCPHVPIFGQLYTILMYLVFAVYFLSNTPMVFSRIREAQYRAAEAFFCIDCKTGIDNISKEGHIPRQKAIGEVIISDVTFNYPIRPLKPILVGINIAVHPGQMITIFGPTNCGKTTVLRLLLRKFDICEGSIQLDGTDLHTLNISWLRSQIGYVPQCPVFLNGTIEENLCGPLKPTMEEILRACRKANVISDILALPLGFKTMVGKKSNSKITPLQVKKLFLARIFLKKCRVVLLDDFFCNVDKSNENQLVKLFESIRENMTLIFTSRKISDIMKTCDTVYVMKEGQIVQYGNHDYISQIKGYYMDLLLETLQAPKQTFVAKPQTDSQLHYYKFAEAINRIHHLRDQDFHRNYNKIAENPKAISSVLLRHNIRNQKRLIPRRLSGGFYKFATYSPINRNYEQNLLRHHLVHERDLRTKVSPETEFDGYPGIPMILRNRPVMPKGALYDKEIYADSSFVTDSDISSDTGSKPMSEAEHAIETIFAISKNTIQRGSGQELIHEVKPAGFLEWTASGLERVQCYFGWPLNSPVDTDSICSEDSYRFWDEYSRRLLLSTTGSRDPITLIGFLKLARYAWPYFILSFVTATIMGVCLVFSVTETAHAHRIYLTDKGSGSVMSVLPNIVYFACLAFLAVFVQDSVLAFGLCQINAFRVEHFAAILEQDMRWFASPRNDIEYLCEFLASDMSLVNLSIVDWIVMYSESSVVLLSLVVIVVLYSGELWLESLTLLVIVPFLIAVNYLETSMRTRKTWNEPTKSESLIYDMMSNIQFVISNGLSGHILNLYKQYEFETKKTLCNCLTHVWNTLGKSLIFGLSRASFLLSFSMWSIACSSQETYTAEQAGYFVMVTYMLLYGIFPMGSSLGFTPSHKDYADSASFITEIHKIAPTGERIRKRKYSLVLELHKPPPSISFNNVTCVDTVFNDVNALEGVSFDVPSGDYVAIVSQCVSANIAMMGLLLRLYDPVEGGIYLNGSLFSELEGRSVRQVISSITQDPDLFQDLSIADNIAYGDNSKYVSDYQIFQAAKMALIHNIIEEMPERYNTKIKDLPIKPETFALLQRIAVARAAIKKPKIVIVNEMTVSVDDDSDRILMKALMNLREGRTFIIISQRIHPIRKANSIVFLKEGTVAEVGTDKELLKKRGLYYELYMSQQLYELGTNVTDIKF